MIFEFIDFKQLISNLTKSTTTSNHNNPSVISHSTQIWPHSFLIEPADATKILIFSLDSKFTGNQIKVMKIMFVKIEFLLQN